MKQSRLMERIREIAGIARLNEMQKSVKEHLHESGDLVLYSPTGTGKTIAYAMSLLTTIAEGCNYVQAVVLVPSRELARQVGEVLRKLAEGYTVLACYGGHHMKDEMNSLEGKPNIIVATPGRLADLLNRGWVSLTRCEVAVIDEVDKILELGFEREMREVMMHAPNLKRKVVTSATRIGELPRYVKLRKALTLDFLDRKPQQGHAGADFNRKVTRTTKCSSSECEIIYTKMEVKDDSRNNGEQHGVEDFNHEYTRISRINLYEGAMLAWACHRPAARGRVPTAGVMQTGVRWPYSRGDSIGPIGLMGPMGCDDEGNGKKQQSC